MATGTTSPLTARFGHAFAHGWGTPSRIKKGEHAAVDRVLARAGKSLTDPLRSLPTKSFETWQRGGRDPSPRDPDKLLGKLAWPPRSTAAWQHIPLRPDNEASELSPAMRLRIMQMMTAEVLAAARVEQAPGRDVHISYVPKGDAMLTPSLAGYIFRPVEGTMVVWREVDPEGLSYAPTFVTADAKVTEAVGAKNPYVLTEDEVLQTRLTWLEDPRPIRASTVPQSDLLRSFERAFANPGYGVSENFVLGNRRVIRIEVTCLGDKASRHAAPYRMSVSGQDEHDVLLIRGVIDPHFLGNGHTVTLEPGTHIGILGLAPFRVFAGDPADWKYGIV